jgi:hypothetical protein
VPSVEWVEPAIVWNGRRLPQVLQPRLAEFSSDNFLPEFLEAMGASGSDSDPAGYLGRHLFAEEATPRLYQPLHGRYYLVTASLVCRQPGLPDKVVDQSGGEQVGFVMRREVWRDDGPGAAWIEQAWIDEGAGRGWHDACPTGLLPDEERFPLHPVKVCVESHATIEQYRPVDHCLKQRTIYHGYLATGNRKKYIEPEPVTSDPQTYIDLISAQSPLEDFRFNQFDSRVIGPWYDLEKRKAATETAAIHQVSLYLILDLGDLLNRSLPDVWQAVKANDSNAIPAANMAQRELFELLDAIRIKRNNLQFSLREALAERANDLGLVAGEGDEPVGVNYDFSAADYDIGAGQVVINQAYLGSDTSDLKDRLRAALAAETTPFQMSDEMRSLLAEMVRPEPDPSEGQPSERYLLRMVYNYDPNCPPLLSAASQYFSLAAFFDSDAPARPVRLELPNISMQDLRKFKRGVGMQMPPALRKLMGRINEETIEGKLGPEGPAWELQMICSFSLQIIFLVAFIVMFIFLIILNIVFWWLPFLRICFPIPRRS